MIQNPRPASAVLLIGAPNEYLKRNIHMKMYHKLAVSLLVLAGLAVARPAAAADSAIRIAVANPSRILQQMQETQDKNKALKDEQARLTTEGQKKVQDLKDLQDKRDKFSKKRSPEYNDQTNEILQKQVELQTWDQVKKAEMTRRHKEDIKALFEKIQKAISDVAQEKKIDLVLTDFGAEIPDDVESLTPEQLHAMISQKNVLYSAPGLDISAEVTARLDAAYKK
jgi:Skp family chaperone for outer membrane proteins